MKFDDLKTKSNDELVKMLLDLKKKQMEMRFKQSGGQVEKTHEIRAMRRDIARVQTAVNAPAQETTKAKAKPAAKKTAAKDKTKEKAA